MRRALLLALALLWGLPAHAQFKENTQPTAAGSVAPNVQDRRRQLLAGTEEAAAPAFSPFTMTDVVAGWDAGADSFPTYGIKGGYDLDGSTQYFSRTAGALPGITAGAPAYPLSVVMWVKIDSAAATQHLAVFSDGTNDNRLTCYYATGSGFAAFQAGGGASGAATASGVATAGRWHCVIFVFASASSRSCYSDVGTTGATETTAVTTTGLDELHVGRNWDGSSDTDGVVACTTVLPFNLSGAGQADNRAAIFAGGDPETVTETTATAVYHFDHDDGADAQGSFDLTPSGSPTAQNNLIVLRDQVGDYHLRATTSAPTWSASAFSNRGGAVFTAASSQFLVHEAAPITAAPFQVYAVAESDDVTAERSVFWLGDKDSSTEFWALNFRGATASDPAGFGASDGAGATYAVTSAGYSADTTYLLWGLEASNVSRAVRIDGGSEGTDTTDLSPDNADRAGIGGLLDATPAAYHNGTIGAVWLLDSADVSERADAHTWVNTEFGTAIE